MKSNEVNIFRGSKEIFKYKSTRRNIKRSKKNKVKSYDIICKRNK